MSFLSQRRSVKAVINELTTYPYESLIELHGLSAINTGNATITIIVNNISIPVPPSATFDDDFDGFRTVNVTGTSTFAITLRG